MEGKLKLSELLTSLPPPLQLVTIMQELPQCLLIVRHNQFAVLVDFPTHDYAARVSDKLYPLLLSSGHRLNVGILPYTHMLNHAIRQNPYRLSLVEQTISPGLLLWA